MLANKYINKSVTFLFTLTPHCLMYWILFSFLINHYLNLMNQYCLLAVQRGNWCISIPYQQHYLISFQDGFQCGFISFILLAPF